MNTFLKHCSTFLFVLLLLNVVNSKPLTREDRKRISQTCVAQTGIDRKIVDRAVATEILPEDNQLYKEFLSCSYKLQGYQSKDGREINYKEIATFLYTFYEREEIDYCINSCKDLGDTPEEAAFQTAKCLIDKLHEVESKRWENSENEV